MSDEDIRFVSKVIDDEKVYLKHISQEIWENPELKFQETHAHEILTDALEKYGFTVQKHYLLPTAFRGEFSSKGGHSANGPNIAILCEYDALPNIGHACGHNLIAESGIAAGMAVKAIMEASPSIPGKVIVLGTPAEEGGGGKIKLLEKGAFDDIDIAVMVHPGPTNTVIPNIIAWAQVKVSYIGKEKHGFDSSGETKNALDAAVMCYNNIAQLRQHIKPTCRINSIISKGGTDSLIIPSETQLEYYLRAPTQGELKLLKERVISCFDGAAMTTGCKVVKEFGIIEYKNLISNQILVNLFMRYAEHFGIKYNPFDRSNEMSASTDMGNVTHVIPGIHPMFRIGSCGNHTKAFTDCAASAEAQKATLAVSKAMALVAIKIMKFPEILRDVKNSFKKGTL